MNTKRIAMLLILIVLIAACGGAPDEPSPPAAVSTQPDASAETENSEAAVAPPVEETMDDATEPVVEEAMDDAVMVEEATMGDGLDIGLFFDGALSQDATIVNCTLSDGTETTCYEITIAGYPANHDVGPFCPETTADTAEAGGIWFDGDGVYDVDGAFILGLADLYNDSNWKLYDDDGNVNTTETAEEFDLAARPNVDPSLQNHCVEGRIEWLDNGEPVPTTVMIPTTPVAGSTTSNTNGNLGITLNGVIIAAPAPVNAILSAYTIAAFDDCGGHINPEDGYHLHGARGCSDVGETVDGETPIFAYALDGYAIHSPLAEADEAAAGLDACQGHTTEADGYHYHAANAADNATLPCFTGLTVEGANGNDGGGRGDGPPQDGGQGGQDGGQGGRPDFAAAAATLGISEDALVAALGGPPPDFDAAAATLGVTAAAVQAALGGGGDNGAPPAGGDAPPPAEESQAPAQPEASADIGSGRLFTIPGDNVFPEGVSYDAATGKFYVGATSDGTLYVGDVNGDLEMTVFSEGGADGRVAAVGTKVDSEGHLWVAGGNTGQVFVYDTADGSFVAAITTPATDSTFINDLAITESGVYFTDSFRPILWRVTDPTQGEAEAWLDFTGTAINYVNGFNLNGIVATEDGSTLIVVHSGEGELYRIDIATGAVARIDTGDTALTAGDGLALVGSTIYVTRNNFGEIVPLGLSADSSTGTGGAPITSDLFGYPTTIAYTGNSFLVANSQFNNRGGTANLPFTVAQIPLVQDAAAEAAPTAESEAATTAAAATTQSTDCPAAEFIDVQPDPANAAYPDPELTVTCGSDSFTVISNGIPNYEFVDITPNGLGEQNINIEITLNPAIAAEPLSIVNSTGTLGMMINGLPIFGPNEAAIGNYGDPYLDGLLDFCGGHTGRAGAYHGHGAPVCLFDVWESVDLLVGYAIDGFPVYAPFVCADDACSSLKELQSSWQRTADVTPAWEAHEYVAGSGDLDECNGTVLDDGSYAYFTTATFPYGIGCIMGEVTDVPFQIDNGQGAGGQGGGQGGQGGGQGGGQEGQGGGQGGNGGGPDFASAAATLGIAEDALRDALGGPPPNFDAAAETLGISVDALRDAIGGPP